MQKVTRNPLCTDQTIISTGAQSIEILVFRFSNIEERNWFFILGASCFLNRQQRTLNGILFFCYSNSDYNVKGALAKHKYFKG